MRFGSRLLAFLFAFSVTAARADTGIPPTVPFIRPNDPYFDLQLALLERIDLFPGFSIDLPAYTRAPYAWSIATDCNRPVIALLSSGVDTMHEDLNGSFVPDYYFRD